MNSPGLKSESLKCGCPPAWTEEPDGDAAGEEGADGEEGAINRAPTRFRLVSAQADNRFTEDPDFNTAAHYNITIHEHHHP